MKRIRSFQGLRAVGFLLVFLWHCDYGSAGAYAVCAFIMMSGFLLMHNIIPMPDLLSLYEVR